MNGLLDCWMSGLLDGVCDRPRCLNPNIRFFFALYAFSAVN